MGVGSALEDDRPVGVAFEEANQNLLPDARQRP